MKQIKYLLFIVFALSIFSCEHNDSLKIQNEQAGSNTIELSSTPPFCTNYVPAFCEQESRTKHALVAEGKGINVNVDSAFYNILPIQLFDGKRGVVINKDDQVYILHQSDHEHLNSKNTSVSFPSQLGELLTIQFDYNDDNTQLTSKISSELGINTISSGGIDYFDLTGIINNDGFNRVRECDYFRVTSVDMFIDEFLYGGAITASHVPGLIEDAFDSCPIYDINTEQKCNYCKDPRCLIDYLVALGAGLSDFQKEILRVNYLRATFNLSEDEFNWLSTTQDHRDFAVDLYNYATDCEKISILDDAFKTPECDVSGFAGGGSVSEDFDECILDILFREELSKKPSGGTVIDLSTVFADCFGPPTGGNYIDCSQAGSATFELTLYAEQPNTGSRDPYSGNPITGIDVGHTFISLSTNFGGSQKTITYGFYPSVEVDLDNPNVPMTTIDDGGHDYSSSVTISLTCSEFNAAINNSISATSNMYDLNDYNCTDYGIGIANSVNLGVADNASPWVYLGKTYGTSSNPGDLGEDIKSLTTGTVDATGGTAPSTNCN